MNHHLSARGFTLVELMVSVAIVAILASIAYPAYRNSVQESRRADAKTSLADAAQVLERQFTETNSYVGATIPATSSGGYYSLGFVNPPSTTTYTLKATPTGTQASDGCGTYTLDQAGNHNTSPGTLNCW